MNITKVTAFKSNDGSLWETEKEALADNVETALSKMDICSNDTYTVIMDKLKNWFINNKSDVRYVLKNIDKLDNNV